MISRSKNIVLTAFIAIILVLSTNSRVDSQINESVFTTNEVKAAFLYNFAKFIEWPDEVFRTEYSPFIIGVMGNDSMINALERAIKGRKIKERNAVVLPFESTNSIVNCHILFVTKSEMKNIQPLIQKLKGKPILLVGDNIEEFCQLGGVINFSDHFNKYGFEINKEGAKRSKLVISSKLLALAQLVKEYEKD